MAVEVSKNKKGRIASNEDKNEIVKRVPKILAFKL
jgi:hypothetical protein